MAIIIPSKNIYGQPQNPKIRDNIIERIEVGAIAAKKETLINDNVYENTESNFLKENGASIKNSKGDFQQVVTVGYSAYSFSYVGYKDRKNAVISISIPTAQNNKQIKKLYFDRKKEVDYSITYSLIGKIEQGFAQGNWSIVSTGAISYDFQEGNISYTQTTTSSSQTIQSIETPISTTHSNNNVTPSLQSSASVDYIEDTDTLKTSTVVLKNIGQENEYYDVKIKIPCDVTIVKLNSDKIIEGTGYPSLAGTMAVSGTYKKYNIEKIEISLFGETFETTFDEATLSFGVLTSKKSFKVEKNELMQTTNYWRPTSENALEKAFIKTKNQYAKGKETATIKCAIADYNDEKNLGVISSKKNTTFQNSFCDIISENRPTGVGGGYQGIINLALVSARNYNVYVEISYRDSNNAFSTKEIVKFSPYETKKELYIYKELVTHETKVERVWAENLPMTFNEYDEVIPMVYGADGKDHPMSRYADGSPKVFKVLGVRHFYDGSVLQELYLQEK